MKRTIALIIAAFAFALGAMAQDDAGTESYGYRFWDNWYLQAGGGVNTVFNMSSFGPLSPAAEFRVGKWFTPSVGFRIGAQGLKNAPNGTETGWFSGYDPFWFGHADLDLTWNLLNTFKYDEKRFWDVCPYLRGSAILTATPDGKDIEPAAGLGIHNGLRLSKRVDLYLEAQALAAREKAWRERGNVIVFPSLTAGVVVRVGRTGFRRAGAPKDIVYEPVYIKQTDTVTVHEVRVEKETVVDSVLIQKLRETPLILYFEIDVTTLTQRELDHLEYYANIALTPDSKILLTGSADKETGNSEHNQWLSEQRNAFVKDILIRVYHIRPENIEEVANGDRVNKFNTPEKNRCVTIEFNGEDKGDGGVRNATIEDYERYRNR